MAEKPNASTSVDPYDRMRRADLSRSTPAELAIREALIAVEAVGADVRLTDSVILLGEARERLADFIDGVRPDSTLNARYQAGYKRGWEAAMAQENVPEVPNARP